MQLLSRVKAIGSCNMNRDEEIRTEQLEEEQRKRTGRIQKAERSIQAYCLMFGDKDNRDLSGEYFTPDTEFGTLDQEIPIRMDIHNNSEFIEVGKAKLVKDDVGIYAVGQLKAIQDSVVQYVEAIGSLIERNILSFATIANADWLEGIRKRNENDVDETGRIRYWPITDVLITSTPSDPRAMN